MSLPNTFINGQPAHWPGPVLDLWETEVVPLFEEGEKCPRANYFRPRPYADEYNRGSDKYGFVYTVQPGNHVCLWERISDGTHP